LVQTLNLEESTKDKTFGKPYVPPPHRYDPGIDSLLAAPEVIVTAGGTSTGVALSLLKNAVIENGGTNDANMTKAAFNAESAVESIEEDASGQEITCEGVLAKTGASSTKLASADTMIVVAAPTDTQDVATESSLSNVPDVLDTNNAEDKPQKGSILLEGGSYVQCFSAEGVAEKTGGNDTPGSQDVLDNKNDENPNDSGKCPDNDDEADTLGRSMDLDHAEEVPESIRPSPMRDAEEMRPKLILGAVTQETKQKAIAEGRVGKVKLTTRLVMKSRDKITLEEKDRTGIVKACCGKGIFCFIYDDDGEYSLLYCHF
jgi:hypothetical protein